jgi:hypothetical protein
MKKVHHLLVDVLRDAPTTSNVQLFKESSLKPYLVGRR